MPVKVECGHPAIAFIFLLHSVDWEKPYERYFCSDLRQLGWVTYLTLVSPVENKQRRMWRMVYQQTSTLPIFTSTHLIQVYVFKRCATSVILTFHPPNTYEITFPPHRIAKSESSMCSFSLFSSFVKNLKLFSRFFRIKRLLINSPLRPVAWLLLAHTC